MDAQPRQALFDYFEALDVPVHTRTLQIATTHARDHTRRYDLVFSLAMTLLVTEAAN